MSTQYKRNKPAASPESPETLKRGTITETQKMVAKNPKGRLPSWREMKIIERGRK